MSMTDALRKSWDVPWSRRAREEAANLNPAFCGELLTRSTSEYKRMREQPLPFPLCFVILPICLHQRTRELLSGNSSASFLAWVAERRPMLAEFPEKVRELLPITREALLFATQCKMLRFEQGGIVPGKKRIPPVSRIEPSTDDANEVRRAAALVGRWFAAQGSAIPILHSFGVTL
jgi:hypothetical protein